MQRERYVLYKNRITTDDLIPTDIQFIRFVDENESQDLWICTEFLGYMFCFYLTEDHKYGILHQDHFTDIQNGDIDGANNAY